MQQLIPYKRIVRIALLTIPLFGIFGVMPMPIVMIGRFSWHEVLFVFLSIIVTVILFWGINIFIFSWFAKKAYRHGWVKYLCSVVLCLIIGSLIMGNTARHEFQERMTRENPGFMMQRNFPDRGFRFRSERSDGESFRYEAYRRRPFLPFFHFMRLLPMLSMDIIIMILLEMIILRTRKEGIERENSLLRVSNIEAKNSLLQQQLQPHFLFNSLSVLKSLITKDAGKADDYIDKLSNLLRYSLYSNKELTVTCDEELRHAGDYLEMQKIRFGNTMNYSISVPPSLMSKRLPVFTIQLLAENALKHNVFNEQSPLFLTITGDETEQTIIVKNNLQPGVKSKSGKGLGLKNLRERYALSGGKRLEIQEVENNFVVTIKVLEDGHRYH